MLLDGEKLCELRLELTPPSAKYCSAIPKMSAITAAQDAATQGVPARQWLQVLDNAISSRIKRLVLAGGEPVLNPHVGEILKYAKINGINATIKTTGTVFNEDSLFLMQKYADRVVLPFCAPDAKTDYELTGIESGFHLKTQAAKDLKRREVFVSAETVAFPQNIKCFGEFVELLDELGISSWNVTFPPFEQATPLFDRALLSELVEKILKLKRDGKTYKIGRGLPFCACNLLSIDEVLLDGVNKCGPFESLYVSMDGTIHPCDGSEVILGNAFKDNLQDVWENNPIVRKARNLEHIPTLCKNCRALKDCRGGCRVYANARAGGFESPDPRSTPGIYSF